MNDTPSIRQKMLQNQLMVVLELAEWAGDVQLSYCFLALPMPKAQQVQKLLAQGESIVPEQWGVVLEQGKGKADAQTRRKYLTAPAQRQSLEES